MKKKNKIDIGIGLFLVVMFFAMAFLFYSITLEMKIKTLEEDLNYCGKSDLENFYDCYRGCLLGASQVHLLFEDKGLDNSTIDERIEIVKECETYCGHQVKGWEYAIWGVD